MKQNIIQLSLLLCCMFVSSLFSFAAAQTAATKGDDGAVSASLTLYNSIVWDNSYPDLTTVPGSNNLAGEDPLFAGRTDFYLLAGSKALALGDPARNPLTHDLAGIELPAGKIALGAFQQADTYTITITSPSATEGTLLVYANKKSITSGTSLYAGTELIVSALPQSGYKLEKLTANGGVIQNGVAYFLTGDVTFEAEFKQGTGRLLGYATQKSGGSTWKVFNNIIYDNSDEYGTYPLDPTNVIADPKFADRTVFVPDAERESPALGAGDAVKLTVANATDIAGKPIASSGSIDAGAYQGNQYTISWPDPLTGGVLKVFYFRVNEAKQKVKEEAVNGTQSYPAGEVAIEFTPTAGYILRGIYAGGTEIILDEKGKGSFGLGADIAITVDLQAGSDQTIRAVVYTDGNMTLLNNIVYDNAAYVAAIPGTFPNGLPVASNVGGDPKQNLLDTNPMFINGTYLPVPNSPAVNKGVVAAYGDKDLQGNDRVQGGIVDMGAYESTVAGSVMVTFSWTDLKDKYGNTYAQVTVKSNGAEIASGDKLPLGSTIEIADVTILDEHYEWVGEVKVNDEFLGVGVTSFTLEEDTKIGLTIRAKQYPVYFEGIHCGVRVYNGNTLIANGEKISYDAILTVHATPEEYYDLRFVSVNGIQIKGAEAGGGYVVTVTGETSILVSSVSPYELDTDGEPIPDPTNPPSYFKPAEVKGQILWDVLNATISVTNLTQGGSVASGDLLEAGDKLKVQIAPLDASKYKLELIEVDGVSQPYTEFEVTIPQPDLIYNKIATTFIGVRYEAMTDDEIAELPDPTPQPGVNFAVSLSVSGKGTLRATKADGGAIQSGSQFESGTVLTVEATAEAGYNLSALTVNGRRLLSGETFTVLETTSVIALFEKERDPSAPDPDPRKEKQVTITVTGNGTLTLRNTLTAAEIESSDWVANDTEILITAVAADGYELTSLLVNGDPKANGQSFILTENSNVAVVFSQKGVDPTPPIIPPVNPNPTPEYVTLTIGGNLPAGVTINPGSGSYQIAKGSNQALTITVDSRYDGQYVYMKLNDRYVLLRDAGTKSTLTYTLVNITGSISIGIVVSETPDLDPDNPSSNVEIKDNSEIWTESGQVCIRTDIPVTVRIVTFNGRVQVQQNLPAGETRIQLSDGFYIVVLSDGTTKKIAVRNF